MTTDGLAAMSSINEWTLTADFAKWIEQIIRDCIDLPFSRAQVEERGRGSQKRPDLTLYDRAGKLVLTGEIKMPDSPDGRSPFQDSLVKDAHAKADRVGAGYFFTSNVNRCVLWRTFEQGVPITDRHIKHWYVLPSPVGASVELQHPLVEERIKQFLSQFLGECAAITSGAEPMPTIPLDEKFVLVWEAALEQPVAQTLRSISLRYGRDAEFTGALDGWMREEQGWTISHRDEDVMRENLERAAKFSCYVLANKIIFYKALRRRFGGLWTLQVPDSVTTAVELAAVLRKHFAHAIRISKDYETVFAADYGDTLPCAGDEAVGSWRDLIRQTDGFDFTQLDYEVIGQVFERMLSTDERHKFGQHYTRSEVVDLINSFCIRGPNDTVLDPACGGGTFLVRAYSRKRDMSGGALTHQQLIGQLHGLDISAYPAHLTTINLATKDLIDQANYPLVARKDFFKVGVGEPVFHVPLGSAGGQVTALQIHKVDAVVGNPPYVRQEKISEYYGKKYKAFLRKQAGLDAPGAELSGRSDIHCFFFTHAFTFLNERGYLGLLTSSTWLDTTYGFRLQSFLLDNFEIIAVFESNCEPWFTGARVTTAAVILRKQPDREKRAANNVKFVWLTQPLADMLAFSPSEADRRLTFDQLRERIEAMAGTDEFQVNLTGKERITLRHETLQGLRIRIVNQGDLHRLGFAGVTADEEDEAPDDEAEDLGEQPENMTNGLEDEIGSASDSAYVGFKWGIFLRAPDIFFKLLSLTGDAFVPLGSPEIASIKRGVTSGCDSFLFPRDYTDEALANVTDRDSFYERHGVYPEDTRRVRIVRAGDGSAHRTEREFLERLVFNLMEIDSVAVDPARLSRSVLLVSKPKSRLRGKKVLDYIRWGESEGFDRRTTCASRHRWYDLGQRSRGDWLWPMAQQYRHIVAHNRQRFVSNHNLFDITAADDRITNALGAVLNSTIVCLIKHQFGRLAGREGNLKTEVVDVKMMLIPDPRRATEPIGARLASALDPLRRRKIGHLVAVDASGDEPTGDLAMPDRQELDDAVLELVGIADPGERKALRAELYTEITYLYRSIRTAEKRMQKFRSETARRGRATPHSIASEIWESLEVKPQYKTILDFAAGEGAEEIDLPEGRARAVNDLWHPCSLLVAGHYIELGHFDRVRFSKSLTDAGIHGPVSIPISPDVCRTALQQYEEYAEELSQRFLTLAAAYTAEEEFQARAVRELWRILRNTSQSQ